MTKERKGMKQQRALVYSRSTVPEETEGPAIAMRFHASTGGPWSN
jgi:hypothetical protein